MRFRGWLTCGVVLSAGLFMLRGESAEGRYKRNAGRGAWPVTEAVDSRYVLGSLQASDLKTVAEMRSEIAGNDSKKYMAVLFTGWDWCEVGSRLLEVWRKGVGEAFVTSVYDWPEQDYWMGEVNLSAKSRSGLSSLYALGGGASDRVHVWPAIGLYDGDGKLFALECGADYASAEELRERLAERAARYEAYLALRAKAFAATEENMRADSGEWGALNARMGLTWESATDGETVTYLYKDKGGRTITLDIYRAALLAEALLKLEANVYSIQFLQRVSNCNRAGDFNQIRSWDSADVSGAYRRLTSTDFFSTGTSFLKQKTTALVNRLAGLVDDTRLVKWSDNQVQQALMCGYNLYRTSGDMTTANLYARAAFARNPGSFWGAGACGRLHMGGQGPVNIGGSWKAYHLTVPDEGAEVPSAEAPGVETMSHADRAAQDGLTLTDVDGVTHFRWVIRHGNDLRFIKQGWHTVRMQMAAGGAPMQVTAFRIYRGTASLADISQGQLLFDGTAAVHEANRPVNGDVMAAFTPVDFVSGVALSAGGSLAFTFYLPADAARILPRWERDWGDYPAYDDIAVEICGTTTGTSSGTLRVTPVVTARALSAPGKTQVVVDDRAIDISTALATLDDAVAEKEGLPAGTPADHVAARVETLLGAREAAADSDYVAALTRAMFFYEQESESGFAGKVSEVAAQDEQGAEAVGALLSDVGWLTDFLASGPYSTASTREGGTRGAAADVLHRLVALWNADRYYVAGHPEDRRGAAAAAPGEVDYDSMIRRLLVVNALNNTPVNNGCLLQTHLVYRDFANRGLLHGDFYTQNAFHARTAVNPVAFAAADLIYAVKSGNTRINYINGTAWQTNYRLNNFFGDSIQGSSYYTPWSNLILTGSAMGREIGAVCGGISYYGVLAANASGRRSVPGGQPAHCAAMHRTFDGTMWEIDSNVTPPTGNHFHLWNQYTYQAEEFFDDAFDDPRTLTGYHLLWAARLRALRFGNQDPGVCELYLRAIEYAPLCYQAILDSRAFLAANYPNDGALWLRWGEAVTNGLWRYPSIGWPLLIGNLPAPIRATYGQMGLLATFKQLQVRMHNSDRKTREEYDYIATTLSGGMLKLFPETADMMSLLGTTLDVRYGTQRFTELVNWGNSYYSAGTEKLAYQTMLDRVYLANGNTLGLRLTCLEALLEASKFGNVSSFRDMNVLHAALFHVNEDGTSDYPKRSEAPASYTQPLLSAEGCLTLSSYPALVTTGSAEALHLSAAAFCDGQRLIDDSAFSTYSAYTQPQLDNPWIQVMLPGDAEVYGVVIENGGEPVILNVEISADANSWTTLAAGRSLAAHGVLQVPFDGSAVTRYVRAVYPNTTGTQQRLELRKFQIYATPRY